MAPAGTGIPTHSRAPRHAASASLLPHSVAFSPLEQALLDDLYDAAELDAICDALFADVRDVPAGR
jgi:hypothetical protein